MFKSLAFLALCLTSFVATGSLKAQQAYRLADSIVVGGSGGWDYVAIEGGKLYVAHNDQVEVIDIASKTVIAHIPAHGSHGTAIARSLGRGFISNGKSNTVGIFDLNTGAILSESKVGDDPDAIVFDSATSRVFAMNGHAGSVSVLDAATGASVGTIVLGGSPEFGVADGKGHLYLNLEDKNETVLINTKTLKIMKRFKLTGGDAPTGLSIDRAHGILFVGCHNEKMIVLNAKTGAILATLPIGKGVDATAYDPATHLAFASNRDGSLTIVEEKSPKKFVVRQNAVSEVGAKTMALDPDTHIVYAATANFGPPPAATKETPKPRPSIIEGSFKILVLKQ